LQLAGPNPMKMMVAMTLDHSAPAIALGNSEGF
jgi:hypothetical protein